ncbi:MAG: DNA polymerase III subunit chi [Rickettsiales bacterium]
MTTNNVNTTINFYHLTTSSFDKALPALLEKAIASGYRTLLTVSSIEQAKAVDNLLWKYEPYSFLPHGIYDDKLAEKQPILISCEMENINSANLLMITDGREITQSDKFDKIVDIFDGKDKYAVESARKRWKKYKDEQYQINYFKQSESGVWQKAA